MDAEVLSSDNPEEIDRRLQEICSPEVPGVRLGELHEAARLFAAMRKSFRARRGGRVLGFGQLEEWIENRKESLGLSRAHIYNYANIGDHLLRYLKDPRGDLQKLGTKAIYLAELASKAECKLTDEFLKESFEMRGVDLEEKVNSLLGKQSFWPKSIAIGSHTTAQAVLLWLGDSEGYSTYTAHKPNKFKEKELGDIADLKRLPDPLKPFENVDVVWVKGDPGAHVFLFEVENTTNVTTGLRRMFQIPYLNAKFFVVAPEKMLPRFEREMASEPFVGYKAKCSFCSYKRLEAFYRQARRYRTAYNSIFNLAPRG